MPNKVEYMTGYIYQITPSLTAVVMCFILKDDYSAGYETALNTDQVTTVERAKANERYRYRIPGAVNLKERAINAVRANGRQLVTEWFANNLPGFFSRLGQERLPTAELITTTVERLFPRHQDAALKSRWIWLLSSFGLGDAWNSKRSNGLSLVVERGRESARYHTIANLRTYFVSDKDIQFKGERGTGAFVGLVDECAHGILVHYSLIFFLLEVSRSLRIADDRFPARKYSRQETIRSIDYMEDFFRRSTGTPSMISELVEKSRENAFYWYCDEFTNAPLSENEESVELAKGISDRIHALSIAVLKQDQEVRRHFEQLSIIFGTRESIRTQRRMELVALLTALIAAGSLFVALLFSPNSDSTEESVVTSQKSRLEVCM